MNPTQFVLIVVLLLLVVALLVGVGYAFARIVMRRWPR